MKYTSIPLPKPISDRIKVNLEKSGFRSVSEFVVYTVRKELDQIEGNVKLANEQVIDAPKPNITIRKVGVLRGELYDIAKKVAEDDDLVIVKTTYTKDGAQYEIEKIIGDPVLYLMRGF